MFLIFVRGVLMGSADIVPGVSGGTIALITGIYGHLVEAISNIRFGFLKPLFKGDFDGFVNSILDEIDFKFLIPLILGIGVAFLTLAKVVTYCMDVYTAFTYAFFLGLIIASAVILFKKLNHINFKNILFALIGCILTFIFVSLNPIATNHSLLVLFISGMIAICAMILPGISGSFLLLLLGQYKYMLNALHNFHLSEIIVFVVGALIGILGFSKILNYLLKNHEEITMAFLIGVMIGSLRVPCVEIANSISINIASLFPCLIVAVIGFAIIIVLETRFDYID
ncbi:putative membrane protein [Methanobrevibacter gottschalkii DSM 11977]|uniref:Putative membrane protein n=1 Tax=Methanobrevibacter gottschalkii DSM 11977 TaxID=1122229 RepID=A0A3N5BX24_9EURY|nr:putative membrane protein [Methanobrevibacter gottschalkii DSM 11977]